MVSGIDWFYGVVVSTADSESADLGSNPSRTFCLNMTWLNFA